MSRFDEYFLMKASDIEEYIREKTDIFSDGPLQVEEIGDGNLNYIFRVIDKEGDSVIVKHPGPNLRIDSTMSASIDRNRIESEILLYQDSQLPGSVPKIYFHDTTMCVFIMEDLKDYKMMRTGMVDGEIYPDFSDQIVEFLIKTQLSTTDLIADPKEKKSMVQSFINPDLCKITEDLVFTEPYVDNPNNIVTEDNKEFVQKELYTDRDLRLEVSKLKFKFMNYPQALIHGDLHTGSIFVNKNDTRIFDPEFGFYGPIGYDLGNVIANLLFAWCNGYCNDRPEFLQWIEESIVSIIDDYSKGAREYLEENAVDPMAKVPGFIDYYVDTIIEETSGYTGTELHRRIVGMAQVIDVTTLDSPCRETVEKMCILAGKEYILNRENIKTGPDFLNLWKNTVKKVEDMYV